MTVENEVRREKGKEDRKKTKNNLTFHASSIERAILRTFGQAIRHAPVLVAISFIAIAIPPATSQVEPRNELGSSLLLMSRAAELDQQRQQQQNGDDDNRISSDPNLSSGPQLAGESTTTTTGNREKNMAESILSKLLPAALVWARQNSMDNLRREQQQQLDQTSNSIQGNEFNNNNVDRDLAAQMSSYNGYNLMDYPTQTQAQNQDLRPSISALSNHLYYPPNEHLQQDTSIQQPQHLRPQQQPQSPWHPSAIPSQTWPGPQRPIFVHLPASTPNQMMSMMMQQQGTSIKPMQQQQQQQHQNQAHQSSASQQQAAGSQVLAFLANNKANLSNLIQLLPLLAQTIATIPKVIHPNIAGPRARPDLGSIQQTSSSSNQTLASASISERLGQQQQYQSSFSGQSAHVGPLHLVSDLVGRLWSAQLPSQQRPASGTIYELLGNSGTGTGIGSQLANSNASEQYASGSSSNGNWIRSMLLQGLSSTSAPTSYGRLWSRIQALTRLAGNVS